MFSRRVEYGLGRAGLISALIALIVAMKLPACGWSESGCLAVEGRPDVRLAELLDPIVAAAVDEGFAGGVAVMRDGELVFDRAVGFSDASRRVPVTAETLFHVASITKYFTAVLTLKAAEDGRVNLTEKVASLVPGTALAKRGITYLDLLTHRSGLGSSYVAESQTSAAGALTAIDDLLADASEAGKFRYSNDGYDLLGILLERASGTSYEALVRQELLRSACLPAVRFWAEVDLADAQQVGQPLRAVSAALHQRNYGMVGSSGLLISATDLVRFQYALKASRLLSAASLAELITPRGALSIGEAALGAFLIDHPVLGRVLSARGYEDWGENAILNHYLDRGIILAIVTSKGPAESTGKTPFRSSLSQAFEEVFTDWLEADP